MNGMTADGAQPRAEGRCPCCGRVTLWVRRACYEGFQKVGEEIECTACGHVFPSDQASSPPREPRPQVFSKEDRPTVIDPFAKARDERGHLCRYCRHYVVNPFRQWCGLHRRDVTATDTCPSCEPKREAEGEKEKPPLG